MTNNSTSNDSVVIGNDSLDFELIVFEPGFDGWLITQPPKETYDLGYLKQKNIRYVREYNNRVLNPYRYGDLYPSRINYEEGIDYGLKLNYMLFMYFEFFQEKYRQRLR